MKFNFNLPKRCPEPLGYSGNDESWEVQRNNSANVQFQDNDFTSYIKDEDGNDKLSWFDDWEARFPEDTWRHDERLKEFVTWVKSTYRVLATNQPFENGDIELRVDTLATLSQYQDDETYSYTIEDVETVGEDGKSHTKRYYDITFTKDTPAYRLTKFRAEASKYMEIESATFYYIFTLFFLMIDSRAKNMFFGFHGSETDELEYIQRKTVFEPYDMDTGLGTNNSGVLKFGYYHLDTDTVSNIISGGDEGDGMYHLHYIYTQKDLTEGDFTIDPQIFTDVKDTEANPDGITVENDRGGTFLFTFLSDDSCKFYDSEGKLEPDLCTYVVGVNNVTITHTDTGRTYVLQTSGSKNAPVFNAQNSVLWANFRDAFRSEYSAMYKDLRRGILNYDYVEKMYEDHQSLWPEALFNEDSYVKYLVPLIDSVTYDEDLGKLIRTDRYLTMLQGSKEQQRKWWLQNRFRYFDSMFTVGSAETSFIEMRLFHSGTLSVTPSQDIYVAVRFGRGSTTQRVRAVANQKVDFQYVFNQNIDLTNEEQVITEMESTIFSANLISDVGDLSVFYGNEFDFSRATRLRRLKLGDAKPSYNNANLTKLNVDNCYLLEEIDCRNCSELAQEIKLDNSTMLEKAYFNGTKIPSISFVPGAPLTDVYLPSTISMLTLIDHTDLKNFQCASYSNIDTLMLENIDQDIINPLEIVKQIKPEARVNIQGFYINIIPEAGNKTVQVPIYDEDGNQTGTQEKTLTTNAEKAGYEIESFIDAMRHMKGVNRTRKVDKYGNLEPGWDYHDYPTPIIYGTIHTLELTGTQLKTYKDNYPYLTVEADSVESKRYYMSQDGEHIIAGPFVVIDGQLKSGQSQSPPTNVVASANTAADYNGDKHFYTFKGWSTEKNQNKSNVNSAEQRDAFKIDHEFYATFSTEIRSYTVTWKNGSTTLGQPETYNYDDIPTFKGTMPKDSYGYTATGWTPEIGPVHGNITYTAQFKPVYTATFVNNNGAKLYEKKFIQDSTPVYAGQMNPPVNSEQQEDGEFTFLGWSPALGPIKGNTTYRASYQDNRSLVVQYLSDSLKKYESDSEDNIRSYGFNGKSSLISVKTGSMTLRNDAIRGCSNLELIDSTTSSQLLIAESAMFNLPNLRSFVIRGKQMALLKSKSVFSNTLITRGLGVIYVNNNLVDTYKANSTWNQYLIQPIAKYKLNSTEITELFDQKFSTTTDSWETIATNKNYATDYTVGTTKKVVDGGSFGPIIMQLVAFDQDDKADGSGKARMTWISQDLITTHVMYPVAHVNYSTCGTLGWADSSLRGWLISDVLPQINFYASSDAVAPVPVTKTQSIYANDAIQIDGQTTTDSIWIPSDHEIFGTTSCESNEVAIYTGWFNSSSRRKKTYYNGSADRWWLRSASFSNSFRYANLDGGQAFNQSANSFYGVVIGFCL